MSGTFVAIAVSARYGGRDEFIFGGSVTPADVTAPPDHHRDDIGTIMARIAALIDDPETLPDARGAWNAVLKNLAEARDELARET